VPRLCSTALAASAVLLSGMASLSARADTIDLELAGIVDPQLVIVPFVSCGGTTTCNGSTPFSLTTPNLASAGLPTFGGSPIAFAITNNTGATVTLLQFTLTGTLGLHPKGGTPARAAGTQARTHSPLLRSAGSILSLERPALAVQWSLAPRCREAHAMPVRCL